MQDGKQSRYTNVTVSRSIAGRLRIIVCGKRIRKIDIKIINIIIIFKREEVGYGKKQNGCNYTF